MSEVFPCFGFKSMPDLMDEYGVSWRYYSTQGASHFVHAGISAIRSVRCAPGDAPPCEQDNPYWDAHVHDGPEFLTDAAAGTLPNVSWYLAKETEHPPRTACSGENATVRAVNAVMSGPDWRSTAIVVWWDEWGGFYDHALPPTAQGIDGGVTNLNALISYGFRVPLLVISPWDRKGPLSLGGYASHRFYSHASFARFVEWAFNLPTLGCRRRPVEVHVDRADAGQPLGLLQLLGVATEGQDAPAHAHVSAFVARTAGVRAHDERRLSVRTLGPWTR